MPRGFRTVGLCCIWGMRYGEHEQGGCFYNFEGEMRCVDIFCRPDGTFGFEEYRRDVEDGRGWFAVGGHAERVFDSASSALTHAKVSVPWLALLVVQQ